MLARATVMSTPALVAILAAMATRAAGLAPKKARGFGDNCECLNWKRAYANPRLVCGANPEFYFLTRTVRNNLSEPYFATLKEIYGEEFCTNFYTTIDDNYCINLNMGEDLGQWCFVDGKCNELNGGGATAAGPNWKKCDTNEDKTLRNFSPENLAELARTSNPNLDLGLLHKMSYPLKRGALWRDVSALWNVSTDSLNAMTRVPPGPYEPYFNSTKHVRHWTARRWGNVSTVPMTPELTTEMQAIKDRGTPFSFDLDEDAHPPHVIVQGSRVYLVLGELTCLSGC